jgi:peptide/nickel transport system substrate-binding protein
VNTPVQTRNIISRRRPQLLPFAVSVCVLAIAGCAGNSSATSAGGGVDSLRVALGYEAMSMDLCDSSSAHNGMFMTENIGEPLVDLDFTNSELKPKLATSWNQVNPTTWQFKIRDGVTYHNGTPLNAKAVADWINRVLNPKLACWLYGSVLDENVKGAAAVDDHTVDITTANPDVILPQRLAFVMIGVADGSLDAKTKTPIGTGPYKFVSYEPGSEVKLERYDKYWGEKPQYRQVTYPIRVESSVRASMAAAGEVDLATMISSQDAKAKGAVNFTVGETVYFRVDADIAPFNDIRVRRALALAIDRNTFVTNVFGGLGKPANAIVAPSTLGYPDDVTSKYDPAMAKSLLTEARNAGVKVDAPFKVVGYPGMAGSNGSEVPDTIVAMLKDVGLNASTQMLETEAMRTRLGSPNDPKFGPALALNSHGNSSGDALVSLQGKLGCEASQSPVCDQGLEALLKKAAGTSGDERATAIADAFRYESQKLVAVIPVAHLANTMIIANNRIKYTPNMASSERLVISEVTTK